MHGVGLCDEYPAIRYPQDWDEGGYDGVFKEGMVMCVEALAAPAGGPRGGQARRAGADHRGRIRAALDVSDGGELAVVSMFDRLTAVAALALPFLDPMRPSGPAGGRRNPASGRYSVRDPRQEHDPTTTRWTTPAFGPWLNA